MSEKYRKYFARIERDVEKIYIFAEKARKIGVDPVPNVESPQARDMAGRVEKLVGPPGIADLLRKWKEEGADQDELCFRSMDWLIEDKLGEFSRDEKVDRAIRLALAIKTEGVVSAPLEGIAKVIIRENMLGGEPYLALYFAGPIRAAGGTVQAFAVLCAEHVRQKMGIAKWIATEDEVARFIEEVKLYDRIMNLQYPSTNEELGFAIRHLTVELNGDPTEQREVSAHRDLPRIETNFVRGGPCLVLNDGVLLKSKKILRIIEKRNIPSWEWLSELKKLGHASNKTELQEKDKAKDYGGDTYKGKKVREIGPLLEENSTTNSKPLTPVQLRYKELAKKNPPLDKYIADIIAGRPVFANPSEIGGHRIRYGRSRNTGLAACGIHPSTMFLLNEFMAIGTQIRIERPGKSGSTMPVTSVEPPIVLLKSGEVKQLWNYQDAINIQKKKLAEKILFLGDMLFGYGEFVENNHIVLPSGYVEEWWAVELEENVKKKHDLSKNEGKTKIDDLSMENLLKFIKNPFDNIPSSREAVELAINYQVGIHPRYLDHWGNVNGTELLSIRNALAEGFSQLLKVDVKDLPGVKISYLKLEEILHEGLIIPNSHEVKNAMENGFVIHQVRETGLWLDPDRAFVFFEIFGFGSSRVANLNISSISELTLKKTALELFPYLTTLIVPDKAPYYMGSRMGRPEKAKERKMKPPVHSLFPIGHDSKLQRSLQNAIGVPSIKVEICQKICPKCKSVTFLNQCPSCHVQTILQKICPRCNRLYDIKTLNCPNCGSFLSSTSIKSFSLKRYFEAAAAKIPKTIPTVKGVKGMSSEYKIPEPIEKGILRAINDVFVYKDGTIRADATDIPLTHFTCKEIDTSVDTIRELGYDVDIYGEPISSEAQIIELKVQDVLLTHHLGDYFVKVANFVDDELEYLYHQPRFYNVQTKYDLIGHYMVGLAPHTSAGIIGRLIGFTYAESGYAHPYWHAAKRRNCFPPQTKVTIIENGLIKQISFEKLYEDLFGGEESEEQGFVKNKNLKEVQVLSFDPNTHQTLPALIQRVMKVPSTDTLIQFRLRTGRSFKVTPDHQVLVSRDQKLVTIKALEVKKGDYFVLPRLTIPTIDIDELDLFYRYQDPDFESIWDTIMLRGLRTFVKSLVEIHGLQETASRLDIHKETLSNYSDSNDTIPLNILLRLLELTGKKMEDVPNCSIGFKQDHTFIPRKIGVNSALMKLIGYYLSESLKLQGYAHSTEFTDQVSIAGIEDDVGNDIKNDILASITEVFGEGFKSHIELGQVTISSHTIHSFFTDILGFRSKSRDKFIPDFIKNLPLNKIKPMLAAYFSGNGSVDSENEIYCSSFSRKLASDLDFCLLRYGIFGSIKSLEKNGIVEYNLRLYGEDVQKFQNSVGFTSTRKNNAVKQLVDGLSDNLRDMTMLGDNLLIPVCEIEIVSRENEYVYSLEVSPHHTLLVNEYILTHNCDGDEDGIMLLLECLLNFSLYYLPSSLGGKMDAPLVISLLLDPREVDGESHNVDYMAQYPLQFYKDSQTFCKPKLKYMKLFANYLGTEAQFEGSMFTHPTKSINLGPRRSMYSVLETMEEKIESQLYLAKTIQAVNIQDVARKVISSHFAPDILGNLRAFSTQSFRCPKCGAKYRRIPLMGRCTKCGNDLLMTVHPGGITKYLSKAQSFIREFALGDYTEQRWKLIERNVKDLTDNPRVKQKSIVSFFK